MFLLRVVGRFDVGFAGVPAELVEDVAGFAGEAGEAVAQGLPRDGQAVVLVLAEAGTDEQGQQFEVITQLDEIQLGFFNGRCHWEGDDAQFRICRRACANIGKQTEISAMQKEVDGGIDRMAE